MGGASLETFGFQWASQIVVVMHIILAIGTAFFMLPSSNKTTKEELKESAPLMKIKTKKRGLDSTYGSLENSLSDYGSISS